MTFIYLAFIFDNVCPCREKIKLPTSVCQKNLLLDIHNYYILSLLYPLYGLGNMFLNNRFAWCIYIYIYTAAILKYEVCISKLMLCLISWHALHKTGANQQNTLYLLTTVILRDTQVVIERPLI